MKTKKIVLLITSLFSLCLGGCNHDNAIYFDGDVLENYQKYDKNYNPDTFEVRKIDSLNNRDDFIFGADISLFSATLESGSSYYNKDGKQESICKILKDSGINVARLRLFHDYTSPLGTPCGRLDLARVISMIKECKEYGLKVLLDFHYSDTWADPGHQEAPYAWKDMTYQEVLVALYEYTRDCLQTIKDQNLSVEYVQIGNEIDNGIIYPYGHIDWDDRETSYQHMYEIISKGSKATREVFPECKIIIHTANALYRWVYEDTWGNVSMEFFKEMKERNLDYDIIGASFYAYQDPTPISCISDLVDNYQKEIGKPCMIVETSYGYTFEWNEWTSNSFHIDKELPGYPVGYQGQTNLILDMIDELASAKNNAGLGLFYWGAEAIPNTDPDMRSSWANQALFTYEGIATPTMSLFKDCR